MQIELLSSQTRLGSTRLARCPPQRRTTERVRPRCLGATAPSAVMPPGRVRRDSAVSPQPQADGGPNNRRDRDGWVARFADGPDMGTALAAERSREDLRGAVLAHGLLRRRAVCVHPALDLAAARREALVAERSRLRRSARACFGVGGAILAVACTALLATSLDTFRFGPADLASDDSPGSVATVAVAARGPSQARSISALPDPVSIRKEHSAASGDVLIAVAPFHGTNPQSVEKHDKSVAATAHSAGRVAVARVGATYAAGLRTRAGTSPAPTVGPHEPRRAESEALDRPKAFVDRPREAGR